MLADVRALRRGRAAGRLSRAARGCSPTGDSAPRLAAALVRELCRALAAEPFGHPPFRHGYDRGTATLLLARRGRAQLVLHAQRAGRPQLRHRRPSATPSATRRCSPGEAQARIVRRRGTIRKACRAAARPASPASGSRSTCANRRCSCWRSSGGWSRCGCTARPAAPSRAASTTSPTGALLHQAAGDIRASRHEIDARAARPHAPPRGRAGDGRDRARAGRRLAALAGAARMPRARHRRGLRRAVPARPRGRRPARRARRRACARN